MRRTVQSRIRKVALVALNVTDIVGFAKTIENRINPNLINLRGIIGTGISLSSFLL